MWLITTQTVVLLPQLLRLEESGRSTGFLKALQPFSRRLLPGFRCCLGRWFLLLEVPSDANVFAPVTFFGGLAGGRHFFRMYRKFLTFHPKVKAREFYKSKNVNP